MQIFYLCSSPKESESTDLKIHVDKDFPSEPSQILELSYDSVNSSLLNDFQEVLSLFDAEQDLRNDGNPHYVGNCGHLQESESIMNSLIASHGTYGTGKKQECISDSHVDSPATTITGKVKLTKTSPLRRMVISRNIT